MKKILNDPAKYVGEMLEGLCAAHPEYYQQVGPQDRVIVRPEAPIAGKVGIVTGGGSGHLPIFTGYVGKGLLDAAAIGDVFCSPTTEQIAEAMRRANSGLGVVRLYGNYGGDVMNFDMAGEILEMEGVESTTVLLTDDVVSAPQEEKEKRRGTGGLVYAFKIAGAKADEKATIDEVTRIAQKTADRCRSVGMALTPCTIPQAGKPGFEISDDEMEMGMGIHGEPGVWRGKLKKADEIAQEMFDLILKDMPLEIDDTASVMVNSLGATPTEELYIVYRYIKTELDKLGVRIVMPLIGHYATSMEMAGMTLTICRLDNELERLIKAPCECAFWKVGTYE